MSVEIDVIQRDVTVAVDQTTNDAVVTAIICTTTAEFKYLFSKKFKSGVASGLVEGWNFVTFEEAFDDENYNVWGDGYTGITKVEAVIGEQTAEGFNVWLPDSVERFVWEAIKHN
jgi:hypothetical protein